MEEKKKTNKISSNSTKKTVKTTSSKKSGTTSAKKTSTPASKKSTATKKVNTKSTSAKKKAVEPKVESKKEDIKIEENKNKPETIKKDTTKSEKKVNKEINKSVKMMDTSSDSTDEIRKLLIIIGAVCAVMLAFYFITEVVIKNKDKSNNNQNDIKIEPDIQYEQILMGSLFNQNESDYYVFVYDTEDAMLDLYNQYISSYNNLDSHLKIYKVNLSEDFNKSYIDEESHLSGSNIRDVKVTGTTLIRIKDKGISSSYEGSEQIVNKLKELVG